ncbi:hypothetical protein Srut_39760 [Streptomyces rutgersensis]|nr:hypothetical protein Srut_39760 [Streptomyces rutgersensis]
MQSADCVRDAFPGNVQISSGHLISRYAADSTRHQTRTAITGLPVKHSGTRYTPTTQPPDPLALSHQISHTSSTHTLRIPSAISTPKNNRSRLTRSNSQPATVIHAEQHRRHGPNSAAITHNSHSNQPCTPEQDHNTSDPTTRPTNNKTCSERNNRNRRTNRRQRGLCSQGCGGAS